MKIKPIGKRILVEIIEEERVSSGIILINNDDEKNYKMGEIISLSEDKEIKNQFAIANRVIFSKNSGLKILGLDKEILILELNEIFGIIG